MSARAAVFNLLAEDEELGLGPDRIWAAQAIDVPPRVGHFLILRWEEESTIFNTFGRSEVLTVWAHAAREYSLDYAPLVAILNRVTEILVSATHVDGADGVLTCADYQGMSPDFNDEGYRTITKNAAYKIVAR